jgi:hypothetical protein
MKKRTTIILLLALLAGLGLWAARSNGAGAVAVAAGTARASAAGSASAPATAPVVTVYKSPTCACCEEWVEYLRASGFRVEVKDGANLVQVKQRHGVPANLASCHTAEVGGYVLEGHVPADVVRQLLAEKPALRGLAVPGMPAGVPGMPEAGPGRASYEILALEKDGSTRLYATR